MRTGWRMRQCWPGGWSGRASNPHHLHPHPPPPNLAPKHLENVCVMAFLPSGGRPGPELGAHACHHHTPAKTGMPAMPHLDGTGAGGGTLGPTATGGLEAHGQGDGGRGRGSSPDPLLSSHHSSLTTPSTDRSVPRAACAAQLPLRTPTLRRLCSVSISAFTVFLPQWRQRRRGRLRRAHISTSRRVAISRGARRMAAAGSGLLLLRTFRAAFARRRFQRAYLPTARGVCFVFDAALVYMLRTFHFAALFLHDWLYVLGCCGFWRVYLDAAAGILPL